MGLDCAIPACLVTDDPTVEADDAVSDNGDLEMASESVMLGSRVSLTFPIISKSCRRDVACQNICLFWYLCTSLCADSQEYLDR